jgi:Na+/phosphate symporter
MIIYLSLVLSIVGLLVYMLSTHARASEAGRIMFAVGLLAFLLTISGSSISIHH